jgi:hypothetical protein
MPDPSVTGSPKLPELANDVFAFVLEFPASEIPLLPEQVSKVLKSDALRAKLQSAVLDYAIDKTKKGGVFDRSDPKLGLTILDSLSTAAQSQLLEQIKKDAPARRIISAFNDFVASVKHTPMGVWVDKERNWLIIVGVVLAVGGTAALFYTRTDSALVNFPIQHIKGKAVPLWSPGNFKLSGSLLEFQPAQRKLGLEVIGEQKWERLDLAINFGVVGSDPQAKQGDDHAFVASRDFKSIQMKYSLGIQLQVKEGALLNPISLGLHASVTNDKFSGGDLSASMKFSNMAVGLKAQTDTKSYSGLLTISGSF